MNVRWCGLRYKCPSSLQGTSESGLEFPGTSELSRFSPTFFALLSLTNDHRICFAGVRFKILLHLPFALGFLECLIDHLRVVKALPSLPHTNTLKGSLADQLTYSLDKYVFA
jgi:hypothetical protein